MSEQITISELRELMCEYVEAEPARAGIESIWQTPLMTCAPIDARFDALPKIAADDHLHPHDLLPTAKSVVVFYIPFTRKLVEENKPGDRPSEGWGLAYVRTNDLISRLSAELSGLLERAGYQTELTKPTHNFDQTKLMARWSHKHLAHLTNLGRFGIHHLIITPVGCTGRFGSLVTEAELGEHSVMDAEEACLVKAGKKCGKCVTACPIDALSEEEFDRKGCWQRLRDNHDTLDYLAVLPKSTNVCAKCAALTPCSFENPVTAAKSA